MQERIVCSWLRFVATSITTGFNLLIILLKIAKGLLHVKVVLSVAGVVNNSSETWVPQLMHQAYGVKPQQLLRKTVEPLATGTSLWLHDLQEGDLACDILVFRSRLRSLVN